MDFRDKPSALGHGGGTPEPAERVPLRSTSIRLRRRRDQAKREFFVNRRSGDFGYQSSAGAEGWNGGDWGYGEANIHR